MDWNKLVIDGDLTKGLLNIVGNADNRPSLTHKNLIELVEAVRNGTVDINNERFQVSALKLTQVNFPKNFKWFGDFINGLMAISTFESLNLGLGSTFGYVLSLKQVETLVGCFEKNNNHSIKCLKIRVPDTKKCDGLLANMFRGNHGLLEFECDITDDAYDYGLLRACIESESNLKKLTLRCTCNPAMPFCRLAVSKVNNRNLNITFEGRKSALSGSIVTIERPQGTFFAGGAATDATNDNTQNTGKRPKGDDNAFPSKYQKKNH